MLFLKKIFRSRPKLLFHICCAPCATYVSLAILAKAFRITWYFYNPNLCCREEYERRLAAVRLVAEKYRLPLIIEPYNHAAWQAEASGWAGEPERGRRCQVCYFDRLRRTATLAKEKGFAYFSTSLLVSPYKDTQAIRTMSLQLAKDLGLYRQKFCGCEYSLQPAV